MGFNHKIWVFLLLFPLMVKGQTTNSDSLTNLLNLFEKQKGFEKDTIYLITANRLAFAYADTDPDKSIELLNKQLLLCRKAGYKEGETDVLKIFGNAYQTKGDFSKALDYYNQSLTLAKKINAKKAIPAILNNIGIIYQNQGDYTKALTQTFEALKLAELNNDMELAGSTLNNLGNIYFFLGKMDKAEENFKKYLEVGKQLGKPMHEILAYSNIGETNFEQGKIGEAKYNLELAYQMAISYGFPDMVVASAKNLAKVYNKLDSTEQAIAFYLNAIIISKEKDYAVPLGQSLIGLSQVYYRIGDIAAAKMYASESLTLAESIGQLQLKRDANEILASIYEVEKDGLNALHHYKLFKIYADSMNSLAIERATATLQAEYEFSTRELEFKREAIIQRWLIFSAFGGLISLAVIVFIVNRNRNKLNIANKALTDKNIEIEIQKSTVEDTLEKLKATQAQLIHSEKMASLGELTAGVAHEIQNPLNFITNFSEVSNELIAELKEEMAKKADDKSNDLEEEILNDLSGNLEKIAHHGKRADGIVKSMLSHSRSATGIMEETDLNALCNEYLKLSYHGMKAKDKSFNAKIVSVLDPSVGKIPLVPQEIGRVFLNLFNNAFYALSVRSSLEKMPGELNSPLIGPEGKSTATYNPILKFETKRLINGILIIVEDNGTGIPEDQIPKIFQPFFTTKPSGLGTGLGLSISYDIITKGHSGKMEVESKQNEFTRFLITLPVG